MNAIVCVAKIAHLKIEPCSDIKRLRGLCRRIDRLLGEMAFQTETEDANNALTFAIEALNASNNMLSNTATEIEKRIFGSSVGV